MRVEKYMPSIDHRVFGEHKRWSVIGEKERVRRRKNIICFEEHHYIAKHCVKRMCWFYS